MLCFSVNMGCCVYNNEGQKKNNNKKTNLNEFSKWLQNLRGSEYFPYLLYVKLQI